MKCQQSRLLLASVLFAATTPYENCCADVILVKAEVTALRLVTNKPGKLSDTDKALLASLSEPGKNFLAREARAVAITVSDNGLWNYRVDGQATTATVATADLKASDADVLLKLLRVPQVASVVSFFRDDDSYLSPDERVSALTDKLRIVRDGISSQQLDSHTADALLARIGDEIFSSRADVQSKVFGNADLVELSTKARALASQRQSDRANIVANFVQNRSTVGAYKVDPAYVPKQTDLVGSLNPVANPLGTGHQTGTWSLTGSTGTFVFMCSPNVLVCIDGNKKLAAGAVDRAIFIPSIGNDVVRISANLPPPDPSAF